MQACTHRGFVLSSQMNKHYCTDKSFRIPAMKENPFNVDFHHNKQIVLKFMHSKRSIVYPFQASAICPVNIFIFFWRLLRYLISSGQRSGFKISRAGFE